MAREPDGRYSSDQPRQRPKCMGLFIAVTVAIIGALDTRDGMAKNSLGDIGADASAAHKRTGRSSEIVDCPAGNSRLFVKRRLALGHAANVVGANPGKHKCVSGKARLRINDVKRRLRKHQRSSSALLAI